MKSYGRTVVTNLLAVIGMIVIAGAAAAFQTVKNTQTVPVSSLIERIPSGEKIAPVSAAPAAVVEGSLILVSRQVSKPIAAPQSTEIDLTADNDLMQRQSLFDLLSLYRPNRIKITGGCEAGTDIEMEKQLFALINKERIRLGLDALFWDDDLAEAARKHSADMACNDFFSHTNPAGETFDERIAAEGYVFLAAGENLYAGDDAFNTPNQAYTGWIYSTRHYRVMTHPDLTEAGIGYVYLEGSRYGGYFTADFGTPE